MTTPIIDSFTLGDRTHFGLEIEVLQIAPGVFGRIKLSLGGDLVGPGDEPVFVLPLLDALEGVLVRDSSNDQLMTGPATVVWEFLKIAGDPYRLPSTEGFDDYDLYILTSRERLRFLWARLGSEPQTPKEAVLARSQIALVVEEFRRIVDSFQLN